LVRRVRAPCNPHPATGESSDGGLVTKVGFDATARPSDRVEGVERALPPRIANEAAVKWFVDNLPPTRRGWLKV